MNDEEHVDRLPHLPGEIVEAGRVIRRAGYTIVNREAYAESQAEVMRLRDRMAAVEKFAAARAEYITAINNCHPDNHADYWRWQGHAEGRRQLSETLGLPVAWPVAGRGEGQC